ncbi:hypothetical protein ABEF95_001384 [Exophiala dermatitidis]
MSPPYQGLLDKGGVWTEIQEVGSSEDEVEHTGPGPEPKQRHPLRWLAATTRHSFFGHGTHTRSNSGSNQHHKLHKTAYLDGLRGFASLLVYCLHHEGFVHSSLILENGFGWDGHYHLATFPWIRTFFSGGHYAVAVFFVISGYVLSAKPLALIHSGDHDRLSENVGSALFRRWLRLYIPVIVTTFIVASLPHVFGLKSNFEPQQTWRDEIWKWYCEFKNFSFVFRLGGDPWFSYHYHVWSIPFEFRGSICIYTSLLAFSRCTRSARLWCEVGLIVYFLYIADGAQFAMFCAGMLLCDLDHLAERQQLPRWINLFSVSNSKFKPHLFWTMLFILGVFLGGCPSHHWDPQWLKAAPGWGFFASLVPQAVFDYKWFFLFWASLLTVASIPRLPWLKRVFEGRFCQYLGRISFAFYLVHGPVLWTLGGRLYAATGLWSDWQLTEIPGWINRVPLPYVGPWGLELNFLVPQLILLPVTLWLAELGTALLDDPSIRFSRWLYGKATGSIGSAAAAGDKDSSSLHVQDRGRDGKVGDWAPSKR